MDTFRVKGFKGQRALENVEKGKRGKHRYHDFLRGCKAEVAEVERGVLLFIAKANTLCRRKWI